MNAAAGAAWQAAQFRARHQSGGDDAPSPKTFACGISYSSHIDAFTEAWPAVAGQGSSFPLELQRCDRLGAWTTNINVCGRVEPLFVRVDGPSGAPLMLLPLKIERCCGLRILAFLDDGAGGCNAPVLFAAGADPFGSEPFSGQSGEQAVAELWRQLCRALPGFDAALFVRMPERVQGLPNPLRLLASGPKARSGEAWSDQVRSDETPALVEAMLPATLAGRVFLAALRTQRSLARSLFPACGAKVSSPEISMT